jgi:flagellar hook-associated protein 1 FlgK
MSLSLALNTALTGLNVNQRTMSVISNNIANANTEGYSRQIVDLESQHFGGVGAGVRIEDISRRTDQYLQTSIYNQTSELGLSNVITDYYDNMQILLGDPAQGNSIDEYINTFFNDLQQLAETPERSSTRAATVESATILAREISSLALGVEELRFRADNEISDMVTTINNQLEELFFINESIAESTSLGNTNISLLDERDLLLEELAANVDIRVTINENNTVDIFSGNGVNLMDYGYSELTYRPVSGVETLIQDAELNPIILQELDTQSNPLGQPFNVVSGGQSETIESRFESGKLNGLLMVRDELFPNFLAQLDQLSATLRDSFNAVHNQGSGYPPATQLTGDAAYDVTLRSAWEGTVQIAALQSDGTPVPSPYFGDTAGYVPLNMNLPALYSDTNRGDVDTQTIIDEINHHFGIPQNRMTIGNLNNVELALVSDQIPGTSASIEFDFELENLVADEADFWVTDIQVFDDAAVNITAVTDTTPSFALDPATTFTTNPAPNADVVTVTAASNHGLLDGDRVRLFDPGGPVNGIPGANFDGYFQITNVTPNSFDIVVATPAVAAGPVGFVGQTAEPPYDTVGAGQTKRTQENGTYTANLAGSPGSAFYDISVNMTIRNEDGTLSTTTVSYRVQNNQLDTKNDRIAASAVLAGAGVLAVPVDNRPFLRAYLVDEEGNELSNTSGNYGQQTGFLAIESMRDDVTFAIDDSTTRHLGLPSDVPARPGTDRGFSHHYGLNNFFDSNELTVTGDTVRNSAINLSVNQRLREEPGQISSGNLQLSNQPVANGATPIYTYELYSGDQSIAQQLAGLGITTREFPEAGGLPGSILSFGAYAGEMLGYISASSVAAARTADNDAILLDGYIERSDAISGVNLDEELANTIIYQNAYSASARVITVTDELFETLLNSF